MTKSLLLICTNCGENYTDKQLYIDHWKVKRGLRKVPTEGEIFDPENTVTVVVETNNEIPFMETNNVHENVKSEHKSTDEYNKMNPHLLHNKKICKEEFGESNVEGNRPADVINLDSFDLVVDLTSEDDDIQMEEAEEMHRIQPLHVVPAEHGEIITNTCEEPENQKPGNPEAPKTGEKQTP